MPAYRLSVEFFALAHQIAAGLPRGKTNLREQLESAAASISLNLSEGAAEYSRKEKARLYRLSLRSAAECSSILDLALTIQAARSEQVRRAKALLHEITISLLALVKSQEHQVDARSAAAAPASTSASSSSSSSP